MENFVGIILKLVSIIMLIVFILSVALLVVTFRKPKKVSIPSLLITIVISLICLVIFSSLINYEPPVWLWFVMCAIGICIGVVWSRSTRVFTKGEQVMSQNSIWYLVIWGGIFVVNQLITIITNRPPDIAMAMLILSTATVWGTSGGIIRKYFQIRASIQLPATANTTSAPSKAELSKTYTPDVPVRKQTAPEPEAESSKPADIDLQRKNIENLKIEQEKAISELDYQRQRLETARKHGAKSVINDAQDNIKRLEKQINIIDQNLAEGGKSKME